MDIIGNLVHFRHFVLSKKLSHILFLVIGEMSQWIKGGAYLWFKIPTGHLPERKSSGKLVGWDGFISFAYLESYVKCFADRKLAIVKNGSGSSRFFAFALCTSPGKRGLSTAEVGVATFSAFKSFPPFQCGDKLKTFLITLKHQSKLILSQILWKEIFHPLVVFSIGRMELTSNKYMRFVGALVLVRFILQK